MFFGFFFMPSFIIVIFFKANWLLLADWGGSVQGSGIRTTKTSYKDYH